MKLNKKHIKKFLIIITVVVPGIYLVLLYMFFYTDLYLTNYTLSSIIKLGFFIALLFPYIWFAYIKKSYLKAIYYIAYSFILIPVYLVSSFALVFLLTDVTGNVDNGFKVLYEINISENESLKIYRTPDGGAFGGGEILPGIERPIFPGIVNRKFPPDLQYQHSDSDSTWYISYKGIKYEIPGKVFEQ